MIGLGLTYKRYLNITKMLQARGIACEILRKEEIQCKEQKIYTVQQISDDLIIMYSAKKMGLQDTKDCVSTMMEKEVKHCILVYEECTPQSHAFASACGLNIEMFTLQFFNLDISCISHVPKHEILRDLSELSYYNKEKLPEIYENDAMVRYIGALIGDIIKITRNDESVYYRKVIPIYYA